MRSSLSLLLNTIRLPVKTYETASELLAAITPSCRGCLILDLRLPDMSGRELQAKLRQRNAHLSILFLSAYGDIETAVAAMKDGAVDFLEKPCTAQRLLDRVQAAVQRNESEYERRTRFDSVRERIELLSPGERDVLAGIVAGKPYKIIAKELGLSYKTVEARRGRLVKKMEVDSMPELVRMVLEFELHEVQPACSAENENGF